MGPFHLEVVYLLTPSTGAGGEGPRPFRRRVSQNDLLRLFCKLVLSCMFSHSFACYMDVAYESYPNLAIPIQSRA